MYTGARSKCQQFVRQRMFVNGRRSSLTNKKDNHYFLNRFVCVCEFFDG